MEPIEDWKAFVDLLVCFTYISDVLIAGYSTLFCYHPVGARAPSTTMHIGPKIVKPKRRWARLTEIRDHPWNMRGLGLQWWKRVAGVLQGVARASGPVWVDVDECLSVHFLLQTSYPQGR